MTWDEDEGPDRARYRRWRQQRWDETYAKPFPELLWTADFRAGALAKRAARRELVRVTADAYVAHAPSEWPSWRRRNHVARAKATAVALSIPDTCAVGGPHAALLHGLPVLTVPEIVEVHSESFPSTLDRRLGFRRIVRVGTAQDIEIVDGMRVTSVERTVLECARRLQVDEALIIADAALNKTVWPDPRDRVRSERALAEAKARLVDRLRREPRRAGNRRAGLVLEICNGWAESALETRVRRGMLAIGLPVPHLQTEIPTRSRVYFADATLTWKRPDGSLWRTVVEADGRGKQQRAENVNRDRNREAEIRKTGAHYVSLLWEHMSEYGLWEFIDRLAAVVPPEVRAEMRSVDRYLTDTERRNRLSIDWRPLDQR